MFRSHMAEKLLLPSQVPISEGTDGVSATTSKAITIPDCNCTHRVAINVGDGLHNRDACCLRSLIDTEYIHPEWQLSHEFRQLRFQEFGLVL
jgi:hypothetical protein